MRERFRKLALSRAFRGGAFATAVCTVCTALAVAVNVFASALPTSWTRIDLSANGLFSLSDESVRLCESLDTDITLYYLARAGDEDLAVYELLQKYAELSPHLTLVEKDPVLYPTFANAYDACDASLDSVIVDGGDKYSVVDATQFYEQELDYTTYSYSTSFAGESALTTAIAYVASDETAIVYQLTGHGEGSPTASAFTSGLTRQNVALQTLSLLTVDGVPDDAAAVMLVSPAKDLSDDERAMLDEYLAGGGKLIVLTDYGSYSADGMPNLTGLLAKYGMSAVEGIIVETDEDYALSGYPYYLLPEINEHDITGPLIENSLFALAPLAHPIEASGDAADALTVTSLLDTTSGAYCKADAYNADTLDKADGDAEGVFSVAMLSENSEDGSAVLWLSTSAFLDEGTDTIVSGTDSDFMLNAISYLTGYEAGITIHAKSLDSDTLLFSASAGRSVSILFLFVLPVGALAAGFAIWLRRRAR